MQIYKLSLVLAIAASGVTFAADSASKHTVSFDRPAVVGGVELKPGEYRLSLDGDKVTIATAKGESAQAEVSVHTEQHKFGSNTVRYDLTDGKSYVVQIRLGGTNQVLEFPNATAAGGGGGPAHSTAK